MPDAKPPRAPGRPFERAVLDTVRQRDLFAADEVLLAALSGGPDSTALVACLAALRDAGDAGAVEACHVDHGLRPGGAAEAAACAALCERLRVPFHAVRVVVGGAGGVQAAARRARYGALREVARRCGASRIATGHTRSDQAETVLLRLLRGAGARGLGAIPPRRGALVRPLLDRSRAEVLRYLRARDLPWLEDPTNAAPRYLRNRVRAGLLPALEELVPGAEARLARTADLLREDDRALERRARALVDPGAAAVEAARVARAPLAVQRRVVRRLWRAATGARRGLDAGHVAAVLRLVARGRPGRAALPGGREARFAYGRLTLGAASAAEPPPREVEVPGPGRYSVVDDAGGLREVEVRVAAADRAALAWPLVLRGRRPGDRFRPERGAGEKKLKAWLIDRKVPRARRDALLVVADAAGRVLALPELGARSAAAGGLEVSVQRRVAPRDLRPQRGCKAPPRLL
jgi:tRNA(Ile)-lysidine synthase